MGPLKGLRFLRANINPGDGGPIEVNGEVFVASCWRLSAFGGPRANRTSLGNEEPCGVLGRTFKEERFGLVRRPIELLRAVREGEFTEFDEVDEAME